MTEKTYTQKEVDELLAKQKEELRSETVTFIAEKSMELADKKSESLALEKLEKYKELSPEMKKFEEDKKMIDFYVQQGALPTNMNMGKMMMCKQLGDELGLTFMETINGMAFVNGKPAIYGETYLALITKAGYKINVIEETNEKVEIELDGPNGTQKGSYTIEEANKTGQTKNSVWTKYPKRMLRYKAIRNAQNVLCPDIMSGAYLTDEAEEIKNTTTIGGDEAQKQAEQILEGEII